MNKSEIKKWLIIAIASVFGVMLIDHFVKSAETKEIEAQRVAEKLEIAR